MLILLLCSFLHIASCARILTFSVIPSYSHQVFFQPIYRELSLRGHQVVAITPNPIRDPNLTNLTEIDTGKTYKFFEDADISFLSRTFEYTWKNAYSFWYLGYQSMSIIFEIEGVKQLIEGEEKFDLVVIEALSPIPFALAAKFKAPLVSITSMIPQNFYLQALGNPTHPISTPELFIEKLQDQLTLYDRWFSTFHNIVSYLMYEYYLLPKDQQLARKYLGDVPNIKECIANTSIMFYNVNPVMSLRRPMTPNVIDINGVHTDVMVKPLPQDLQNILDNAKQGVVYFSLGTNIRILPDHLKETIVSSLRNLPYAILLKWNSEDIQNPPKNVIIRKWFPQKSILRHKNVKVFVTQGGMQSSEESIVSAVPMVVIPFLGDQPFNAKMLVSNGVAISLDHTTLTEQKLRNAILEVAQNPKYQEQVNKYQELTLDKPMSGLETIIWWCEYVIRHQGASHLRHSAIDLPLYQYYLLDVILITVAGFFVTFLILNYVIRIIKKYFNRIIKSKYN